MPQPSALPHIVAAKFNLPRSSGPLVERTRLLTTLDLQRPLTIVVAPAGYGKTTLVSRWAMQSGLRVAWLSLDQGDNSISAFTDCFLAALRRLSPEVAHRVSPGPGERIDLGFLALARRLADVLDSVGEQFCFVLDDYQHIGDPNVHRFLAELLRFPPHNLNMVIISRFDPPLPLASMRGRAQLAEIRTQDLRFTLEETAAYVEQELHGAVDHHAVALLEQSTEGWAAGLRLATLQSRRAEGSTGEIHEFKLQDRLTAEYLALEVLAKQDEATQQFLLKTSILQRMCPALCSAVLGNALDHALSRRILDQLDSDKLFITTLDDARQWYRYHPLFQQLLYERLHASHSTDQVKDLCAAASHWCGEHQLIEEAIAYATAAGNIAFAIECIESQRHQIMNAEQWQQLERWLNQLARRHIDAHPQTVILEAWILHKRQRLAEIPSRLDLAVALLKDSDIDEETKQHLQSEVDALRSQQHYNSGNVPLAYAAARKALANAPLEYAIARGLAWMFVTAGLIVEQGPQSALGALAAMAKEVRGMHYPEFARVLIAKCLLLWMAADMPALERTASELQRYAALHELPESSLWAHYFRGCAAYQQNRLELAGEAFAAVVAQRHLAPGFTMIQGSFGRALQFQAQEMPQAATATVMAVLELAQQTGDTATRQTALAFRAFLAILQDRPEDAFEWVAGVARNFQPTSFATFFAPPIATANVLIRQGSASALAEAEQMLEQMDEYFLASHNYRFRIEVLALKSLLYSKLGQQGRSLSILETAIVLAQGGDVQRVFLDLGPAMSALLAQLDCEEPAGTFVRKLCAASRTSRPGTQPAVAAVTPTKFAAVLTQPRHPDLLEMLTNRELEVLQLLALRQTNKEIATTLGITTGTVKQHTINLFRKLHVENRREAIVQARAMGFQFDAALAG